MKKTILYIVWAVFYCVCVGLGFVADPTAGEKAVLIAISIGFFVPPYWLYFLAKKEESRRTLLVLRLISICVIVLTPILLCLNILSVNYDTTVGLSLYVLFVMFSAPLATSQTWVLPLFLWAVLMMLTLQRSRPCQK